jgi:hypothetical protein
MTDYKEHHRRFQVADGIKSFNFKIIIKNEDGSCNYETTL